MYNYPDGVDRLDRPEEASVEEFVNEMKVRRFAGTVLIAATSVSIIAYAISVTTRLLVAPFSGSSSWFALLFAELVSPAFYVSVICFTLAVALLAGFFMASCQIGVNVEANESLAKALKARWKKETSSSFAEVISASTVFFVASSLMWDLNFSFLRNPESTVFMTMFLLLEALKLTWQTWFGPDWVLESGQFSKGHKENYRRSARIFSRLGMFVSGFRWRNAVGRATSSVLAFALCVCLGVGLTTWRRDGTGAALASAVDLLGNPRSWLRTWVLAIGFAWFRFAVFNVWTVFFTGPQEFPIGVENSSALKLHQALASKNTWVKYLAFADLKDLALHSSSRRAAVFHPAINGQVFDKVCHAVLSAVNEESTTWEHLGLTKMQSQQQQQHIEKVAPATVGEPQWLRNKVLPEGMRPRAFAGPGPAFGSPVSASTPVRRLESPCWPEYPVLEPAVSPWAKGCEHIWARLHCSAKAMKQKFEESGVFQALHAEQGDPKAAQWLVDSQPIVWGIQGLSYLLVAALQEDSKGLVRFHVCKILAAWLRLRKAVMGATVLVGKSSWSRDAKWQSGVLNAATGAVALVADAYGTDLRALRLTEDQLVSIEECKSASK